MARLQIFDRCHIKHNNQSSQRRCATTATTSGSASSGNNFFGEPNIADKTIGFTEFDFKGEIAICDMGQNEPFHCYIQQYLLFSESPVSECKLQCGLESVIRQQQFVPASPAQPSQPSPASPQPSSAQPPAQTSCLWSTLCKNSGTFPRTPHHAAAAETKTMNLTVTAACGYLQCCSLHCVQCRVRTHNIVTVVCVTAFTPVLHSPPTKGLTEGGGGRGTGRGPRPPRRC